MPCSQLPHLHAVPALSHPLRHARCALEIAAPVFVAAANGDKAAALKSFLGYTATDGQAATNALGAAPLPAAIQTKVVAAISGLS